ncbi:MAG: hypothetical protein WDN69_20380 [Aliidongia sp.]
MMDANFEAEPARGFGYGEHLLVWSWRRIAAGRGGCPLIAREFAEICGEDAAEVVATLDTFLRALAFAGRRAFVFGPPGSLTVTADERQILELIAAAQAGRPALFEAHLQWLARPDRRPVLQITAGALATALKVNDLHLTVPEVPAPVACRRPLAVVPFFDA